MPQVPNERPRPLTTCSCQTTPPSPAVSAPPPLGVPATDVPTLLNQAAHLFDTPGERHGACRRRLVTLQKRFKEGRFHPAVLGQFRRRKSRKQSERSAYG